MRTILYQFELIASNYLRIRANFIEVIEFAQFGEFIQTTEKKITEISRENNFMERK